MTVYLSFVVPTYNRASILCETLDSILDNIYLLGYSSWEIIIVDDKSTDNTTSLKKEKYYGLINEKKIRLLELEVNRGVTFAKNAGGEAASGDWLIFLDSDDLLLFGGLETIQQVIYEKEKFDAIFFSCIDFNGNIVGTKFESQKLSLKSYEINGMFGEKLPVIKKNIFNQIKYDDDLRGFEGLMYFKMLACGYNLWISNIIVRKYRTDSDIKLSSKKSILKRADKMLLGYNRLILEYYKISLRPPFMLYIKAYIYKLIAYIFCRK